MTGADPITVLRVHLAGEPAGRVMFYLCRASVAARLAADAAASADEVTDLGPGALPLAQAANRTFGRGTMVEAGVAEGGRWVTWNLAGPPPEVPPLVTP